MCYEMITTIAGYYLLLYRVITVVVIYSMLYITSP